jgi:hypothetical protein
VRFGFGETLHEAKVDHEGSLRAEVVEHIVWLDVPVYVLPAVDVVESVKQAAHV